MCTNAHNFPCLNVLTYVRRYLLSRKAGWRVASNDGARRIFMAGVISSVIESACQTPSENEQEYSAFDFPENCQPSVSFFNYVKRLSLGSTSDEALILALVFLDRFVLRTNGTALTSGTSYRLFATALILAWKMHHDLNYSNKYHAKLAGLPLAEVNSLEIQFLCSIEWDLFVSREEFEQYSAPIHQMINPLFE